MLEIPHVEQLPIRNTIGRSLVRLLAWMRVILTIGLGNFFDQFLRRDTVERRAARFRRALERAGGTFVKLGQQLAMRVDLLPWAYCVELSKMLDRMVPFPTEQALQALERTIKRPWQEVFAVFDPKPIGIEVAPPRPLQAAGRTRLLQQLAAATGVFFGGGDQARIMDVLQDRPLLEAFRRRYSQGVAFGGTSAGTAIMSPVMIVGADADDWTVIDAAKVTTAEGLGLLPGVILDQHFIKRQRENRLFGQILKQPHLLGVGVDEDAALLVEDGRHAEVVGGQIMLVDGRETPGALVIRLLINFRIKIGGHVPRNVAFPATRIEDGFPRPISKNKPDMFSSRIALLVLSEMVFR